METRKTVRIIAAGVLAAASIPAFAHHDSWHYRGYAPAGPFVAQPVYGPRPVVVERPVYVDRPVYVQQQPVYVQQQPVYAPPPVVYYPDNGMYTYNQYPVSTPGYEPQPQVVVQRRQPNVVGVAAGAAVGAVIGNQVGDRHSRAATTAIGAAIGGIIGSQF